MYWLIYFISIVFNVAVARAVEQSTEINAAKESQLQQQQQLDYLDDQIKRLENERDTYKAKAVRAQDQGDRLQFENGMLTDARRYWQFADACNEIAAKIDQQITLLKKQRSELIKQMQQTNAYAK
ncbi:MAG: hypothetical protein HY860_05945 [Chlamydiales bacterium]|nr:hypothetical protein [Chlamydiales bacterium]